MKTAPHTESCPLCGEARISPWFRDRKRDYLHCPKCDLVFVPEKYHLSPEDEKSVYDLHQNDPEDPRYRKFLSRLSVPLLERLPYPQSGLDFGCGPGPALARLLEDGGHTVSLYDPCYFNSPSQLNKSYDFVTATEVIEHLREPELEFKGLFDILREGGILGLITKMVIDKDAFSRWHYIQDPTHICFYSRKTFAYLAAVYNAELEFIGNDVILLKKTAAFRSGKQPL